MSSGEARFSYRGYTVSDTDNRRATAVIQVGFSNFVNIEGSCDGIYHYLFLSNGEMGIMYCIHRKNVIINSHTVLLVCVCVREGVKFVAMNNNY